MSQFGEHIFDLARAMNEATLSGVDAGRDAGFRAGLEAAAQYLGTQIDGDAPRRDSEITEWIDAIRRLRP